MNGMPATILEKPGSLTPSESERMRMHAYYTDRMLARPPALGRIGSIAALATERLDGSGYHRGLSGGAIPATGRILAAADAFQAMREPRPYREALAARRLAAALRSGRPCRAAGRRRRRRRPCRGGSAHGPAASAARGGLTAREVEVLVLIARGASNKQVAGVLGIAPKTAGTHIERIYSKIGASTRSTATLFAMQQGLLDSLEPLDL